MRASPRARGKIVQRNDTGHGRSQRLGNVGIAHVGDVPDTIYVQVMNLGVEGFLHLRGGPGEVDRHAAGRNRIDRKAVGFQPLGDGGAVGRGRSPGRAEFTRGHPAMVVGRSGIVKAVDILLDGLFIGGGARKLQDHVLHGKIAGHGSLVVLRRGFGTCVAGQRMPAAFVNGAADKSGTGLRGQKSSACQEQDRQMQ